jgi:hypothetical protein
MAALVAAIHVLLAMPLQKDVDGLQKHLDGRNKSGHHAEVKDSSFIPP